jgi:hypothetical protein
MTNNEARQYFTDQGLSYSDIGSKEIAKLGSILKSKLDSFSNGSFKMQLVEKGKFNFNNITGTLINGSIRVNGTHFEDREGITFNKDGFIGFSGWADSTNKVPFIESFIEWVNALKN